MKNNIYRSNTFLFPKNHNAVIKVVHGVWDYEHKQGVSNVELNTMNAYIDQQYVDTKTFVCRQRFLKDIQERVNVLGTKLEQEKLPDRPFEPEKSYLMTIINEDKHETIKFPSVPINIVEDGDKCMIQIFGTAPIKIKKGDVVHIDITNDPTPFIAGGIVSLGYYCWRFTLLEPEIKNTKPFVIFGKSENLKFKLIRPCRRTM